MYIGKIAVYFEKTDIVRFGNKLRLSFYDDNNNFVTSIVLYSKIDKCYSFIMKICGLVVERDNYTHMAITENRTFNDTEHLSKYYSSKIVFTNHKLI